MITYESHNLEDRALPFIYKKRRVHPNSLLDSSNWHENIEILCILEGKGIVYNNGQSFSVSVGDILVINANHLHTLEADGAEMLHRYLIVDRAFCLANGIDTNEISFRTRIHDPRITAQLRELDEAYEAPPTEPYRTASIRSAVLRLILLLCRHHSTAVPQAERPERSLSYVKQAINYIRASYSQNFSLEDAAAFVGVNKCYLSREFHKYTGCSFVTYVNRTRCKMAQQLLLDGQLSVHEIGIRCGFENRSYFAKTFRKYVGIRPGEYREQARKGHREGY